MIDEWGYDDGSNTGRWDIDALLRHISTLWRSEQTTSDQVPLPHNTHFHRRWKRVAADIRSFLQETNDDEEYALTALYWRLSVHTDTSASLTRRHGFQLVLQTIFPAKDSAHARTFYRHVVPFILTSILALPQHFPAGALPLLRRRRSQQVLSLSRLQVAALISTALFGLLPTHNAAADTQSTSSAANINGIFYNAGRRAERVEQRSASSVPSALTEIEKARCIFHYLSVVHHRHNNDANSILQESIHFHRRRMSEDRDALTVRLEDESVPSTNGNISVSSVDFFAAPATIEDDDFPYKTLQIDFANKYIGGGVLERGCVQEEIRFLINTELLAALFFCEVMDDDECIIIVNTERYCKYTGYDSSFSFNGGFTSTDTQLDDIQHRRIDCVVALDAMCYHRKLDQYETNNINRELCKALTGFSVPLRVLSHGERTHIDVSGLSSTRSDYTHISTGNWGCGAFQGDITLKLMIQTIAATLAGRRLRYFTFNAPVRALLHECVQHCVASNVTVKQLWSWTLEFSQLVTSRQRSDDTKTISNNADEMEQNVALYVIHQCRRVERHRQT